MPLCGGISPVREVDDDLLEVLAKVEAEVKAKIGELEGRKGQVPLKIEPLAYKAQVVAGRNFFVKVKIDDEGIVHARIYRDIQGNVTLHSVTGLKTDADDIEYF